MYNSGDGVSLTIAETQADFHYLSGDVFRQSAELHSLLPDFPSSETQIPAMTLQITLFPKRGFSIAYVVHHAIVDGKSISMFMHSWAYICKRGDNSVLPPELTPSFNRTFVEHHKELEKVYPKGFGNCRLRLDPPLPPTYFGNCLAGSEGYRDTDDFLAEDGFVTATSAVSDALENLNEGILKLVEKQSRHTASPVTKSFQVFNIGGSPRFELNKVDFGWGKSVKVDIISNGGGEIGGRTCLPFFLLDDRDGNGGIEIGIALGKHEAEAFATIFANGLKTR